MTLRLKLLTLYVCVGVAVLALVGGLLSAQLRQDRSEEIGRGITNQLKHLDFALTSFLEEVENDVQALAADPLVRSRDDEEFTSFLDADEETFVYSIGELEQSIIDTLNTFRTTHPYVNSVYMGRENGSFVRSHKRARPTQYDPRERPWYVLAKENPGQVMRTEPYRSVTTPDVNLGVVTALVDESGGVFGVVGADVTLANLTDYISAFEVGHEGHMLLVDEQGTILASRDPGLLMTSIEDLLAGQSGDLMDRDQGVLVLETDSGTQYLYSYTSPKLGWKIAAVIPREEIDREIWRSVFVALLGLFLALVLLSVLTLVGLNAFVVNPLRNLNDVALDIARTGSLDRRIETRSTDELGSLAASFNQMIAAIGDKESALRASEAELEKHRDHLEDLVNERTAELDTAVREMAVLNRVSRDLVEALDLESLLPTVVQRITEAVEADRCAVFLFDERVGLLRARAAHGYMAERLADFGYRPGEEIAGQAYATGEPQYVPDLDLVPDLPRRDEIRAVLAMPLASPTAGPMGVLSVTSLRPDAFTPDQQRLLETLAGQIARAIENARLYQETERHAADLAALYEVGKEITSTLELNTMLQTIADDAARMVGADKSLILLIDAEEEKLTRAVGHGYGRAQLNGHIFEEFRDGISGWVLREKVPTLSADIQTDERNRGRALASARRSGDRSAAVAPLVIGDEVIGTLTVVNSRQQAAFTEAALNLVAMLAGQAAIAIQNARLYEATQEADRLKSQFLANMSHELRTPLNSIIGYTKLMLDGLEGPINEEQREDLRIVYTNSKHLLQLINDLLDLSRIEAGKIVLSYQTFTISELLAEVIPGIEQLVREKGIALVTSVDPSINYLYADKGKTRQVLINILGNAVKFTNEGSIKLNVAETDTDFVFSATDTGIGIKKEHLEVIFDRFEQVGPAQIAGYEGTGLGLTISKQFVEMQGGRIWAESEPGKGSTFTFTLPKERVTSP